MTQNKTSFLIGVSGTVKHGERAPFKNFNQHFVVSKIDDKLKIISDTVRITEAPYSSYDQQNRRRWVRKKNDSLPNFIDKLNRVLAQ